MACRTGGGVAHGAAGSGNRVPEHGETPVRFLNVHSPALASQKHLETLDRLVRAGKIRGTKDPRSLIYMSMSAAEYRPDVTVKPPPWVARVLAFIGRRLGYTLG